MTLGTVIFVVLLILKLAGIGVVATWSWWWVTLPLWGGIAVAVVLYAIAGAVGGVIGALKPKRRSFRR